MSYHNERVGGNHNPHYVGDLSEEQRAAHPATPPRLVARVLGDYAGIGATEARPRLVARVLGHYVSGIDANRLTREAGDHVMAGVDANRLSREAGLGDVTSTASLMTRMNADLAIAIRPAHGAIDAAASVLNATMRAKLKTRPLDFFLDIFDPIESIVLRAVARVNAETGKSSRNFFGTTVAMQSVQASDARLDAAAKNFVKRLRMMQHYMVLTLQEPIRFPAALVAEMLAAGLQVAQVNTTSSTLAAVSLAELQRTFMTFPLVSTVPSGYSLKFNAFGPTRLATVNQNGVLKQVSVAEEFGVYAPSNNRNAVRKATGFVRGMNAVSTSNTLRGLSGLGADPVTAEVALPTADAAAKAIAITGVPWLDGMIIGTGTIITAASAGAVAASGEVFIANEAIKRASGGRLDLIAMGLDRIVPTSTPNPTKVGPAGGGTTSVPAGGSGSTITTPGGESTSNLGPVVVIAGAAALVFFLLRSSKGRAVK